MNKQTRIILSIIAIAIIGYFIYQNTQEKEHIQDEVTTIKIGAILPLTGRSSIIGKQIKGGLELAVKGNKYIELIIEDCQGDPKQGVMAYKKLKNINKISIFIPTFTGVTNAVSAVSEEKDLLFSTSVSASNITLQNNNLFRLFVNAKGDADKMAFYCVDSLKIKKIAILKVNDDFGKDYSNVFEDALTLKGGQIIIKETIERNQSDFKNVLLKLKIFQNEYDAVYILAYDKSFSILLKQYSEFGLNKPILSIATIGQSNVINEIKSFKSKLPKIYYTNTLFNSSNNTTNVKKEFVEKFKSEYGMEPNYFAAFAYDLLSIIAKGTKLNSSNEEIKKYILNNEHIGVMGEIKFSKDRDAVFPMIIEILN